MAVVVRVDDRGRIRIPRRLLQGQRMVMLIPAGSRIVLIPIPPRIRAAASGWLPADMGGKREAERMAEEEALKEVEEKLARRAGRSAG